MKLRIKAGVTWESILNRFPETLQAEIKDERPEGDAEDIKELQNWKLKNPKPVEKDLKELLADRRNQYMVAISSSKAVDAVNKVWGTHIKYTSSNDAHPDRYINYSKMPGETAKPSILVNGEIYWGCGRFIAALIRGDKTIRVWDIVK